MKPVVDRVVAGRYRLLRPLAEGGMGAVWLAHNTVLDVEVALKFILGDLRDVDDAKGRFEREAKAAARLRSPHVTHIYDYGLDDGAPFIAMELLDGEDLEARIARRAPLDLEECIDLVRQLCRGLTVAHAAGIVHRDLKPSNIFLAKMGDQEVAKLLDFGIAKELGTPAVQTDRTRSGVVMGSPRYMSPEQTQAMAVDPRSDLWSLAAVAFEMVTGQCAFEGEVIGQIINAICSLPLPLASERRAGLPAELDRFFIRALARDPERRFSNAAAFAEAFEAAAQGRVLQLPPPSDPLARTRQAACETQPRSWPAEGRPSSPPFDTAARAIGVVSASPEQRGRLLGMRTVAPIALGLLVASLGWYGGRQTSSLDEPARAAESAAAPVLAAPPAPSGSAPNALIQKFAAGQHEAKTASVPASSAHEKAGITAGGAVSAAPPVGSVARRLSSRRRPVLRQPIPIKRLRNPSVEAPQGTGSSKVAPARPPSRDEEFGI